MVRKVSKRCAPNSTEGGDANEQSGPVPANEAVAASTLLDHNVNVIDLEYT